MGGKSAFVLCPDADLDAALDAGVRSAFVNNGQTWSATSRLVVTRDRLDEVEQRLAELVGSQQVGGPLKPDTQIGPVASAAQYRSIQTFLERADNEGTVITGGAGRSPGDERGWFVRPTVVSRVSSSASVALEEIFGPVLTVVPADTVDEAIEVANNSDYGLSGAVWAGDVDSAIAVARRLRTGQVSVNGGRFNVMAPFGGFKKSGVGRELGPHGLAEYFELISRQLPVPA